MTRKAILQECCKAMDDSWKEYDSNVAAAREVFYNFEAKAKQRLTEGLEAAETVRDLALNKLERECEE